jgi:hypothetical protein
VSLGCGWDVRAPRREKSRGDEGFAKGENDLAFNA